VEITGDRVRAGRQLTAGLADVPGMQLPAVRSGDTHSYWFYLVRLEPGRFRATRDQFAAELASEGVACTPGYIPRPVYQYPVFQNHNFFGGRWPVRELGLTRMNYRAVSCPVAEAILQDGVKLTVNEAMTESYVTKVVSAVRQVAARLAK
jgi:dTDP-4-amino-4,6-dideoxygalactose transaminase